MKNHLVILTGILAMTLLLSECKSTKSATTAAPAPTTTKEAPSPAIATAPSAADAVDISAGQSIFTSKCHECHKQPNPKSHDDESWANIMVKMGRKAHLAPTEVAQVLKYISSARNN